MMQWHKAGREMAALRDLLLVVAGFVYACGYVTWIVFSWAQDLPPRSALDAQYFVAGMIPASAIAVICWLFMFVRRLPIMRSASPKYAFFAWFVAAILGSLFWVAIPDGIKLVLLPVFVLAFTLAMDMTLTPLNAKDRAIPWSFAGGGVVALLLTLLIYAAWFYPTIPMELGGGRPRCVILQLELSKIGVAAWQALEVIRQISEPERKTQLEREIAEEDRERGLTGEVYLWSMTEKWTLLGDDGQEQWFRRLEIPTDAISSMMPCSGRPRLELPLPPLR